MSARPTPTLTDTGYGTFSWRHGNATVRLDLTEPREYPTKAAAIDAAVRLGYTVTGEVLTA